MANGIASVFFADSLAQAVILPNEKYNGFIKSLPWQLLLTDEPLLRAFVRRFGEITESRVPGLIEFRIRDERDKIARWFDDEIFLSEHDGQEASSLVS